MSYLTLPTRQLVGLLADALRTAGKDPDLPVVGNVLLHTDIAKHPVNGDDIHVLVATATDLMFIGQASAECDSQLHRPVLVSTIDAKSIAGVFVDLIGKFGREITHLSEVELSGDTLTVREERKQSPDGKSISVFVQEADDYPHFAQVMSPTVDYPKDSQDLVIDPTYGTAYPPERLAVFAAIGKRRKEPVMMYRHHQDRNVVVTVGLWYRGALRPAKLDDVDYNEPQVPVFTPSPKAEAKGAA